MVCCILTIISILKKDLNKSSISVTPDIITLLPVHWNPKGCTFLTCILASTHNAEGIMYEEHKPNQMDGKRLPKGAKGQKRQGGSKSPLKPKWVVLSLWGNRAVAKHSERGQWRLALQPHSSPMWPIHSQNDIHATLGLFRALVLALDDQMTARVWAPLRIKMIQGRKRRMTWEKKWFREKGRFQGFNSNMN